MAHVLIVDDEPLIRSSLVEFLQDEHEVESAESGPEAIELLAQRSTNGTVGAPFDLLISDINMRPMNGIDLLVQAKERWPGMRRALITGYDVDDYIRLIKRHGITNVITKSAPFDFDEFVNTVRNILDPRRVFGLKRLLGDGATITSRALLTHDQKDAFTEEMIAALTPHIDTPRRVFELRLVFEEIANNAFFHAFRNPDGTPVHSRERLEPLNPGEEIVAEFGLGDECHGFGVSDNAGSLTTDRFLEKIERQVTQDGLMDEDGRGFFLARAFSSRLIVNIEPSKRTEIMVLFSRRHSPTHKPLYLNLME